MTSFAILTIFSVWTSYYQATIRKQPLKASQIQLPSQTKFVLTFLFLEQPLKASQLYIAIVLTFVGKNKSVLKLRVSDKHFTWIEPVTEHSEQSQIYCENQGLVYVGLLKKREFLNTFKLLFLICQKQEEKKMVMCYPQGRGTLCQKSLSSR